MINFNKVLKMDNIKYKKCKANNNTENVREMIDWIIPLIWWV